MVEGVGEADWQDDVDGNERYGIFSFESRIQVIEKGEEGNG